MANILARMFPVILSFISSCVSTFTVSCQICIRLYDLNLHMKSSTCLDMWKLGPQLVLIQKEVKFVPRNTFLKTPQSDFDTAAESCWVLYKHMHHSRHTEIMLYVRKAVTVLVLLFSVRQLQCISLGHLACIFTSEWNSEWQGLKHCWEVIHAFLLLAYSGIVLICSNLVISQTVLRSGLSQQHMLGSVPNRHFRCYCTILRTKIILVSE